MSFTAATLAMSWGVIVWALHFAAIYGVTALACARGAPQWVEPAVLAATLVASAALAPAIGLGIARRARFEWWIGAAVAGFALLGVLWEGLTVFFIEACA